MVKEYSPFTPGVPVPIEFFVGRNKEIERIIESVGKSVNKKTLESMYVSGERGIGKSSLCNIASAIAEDKHEVLGVHVYLGGVKTLEEMVKRVFDNLLSASRDRNWFETVKDLFGRHVTETDLFGINLKFEATDKEISEIINDLPSVLSTLLKKLEGKRKGLLIIMDDLNGMAESEIFANWLKSFIDKASSSRTPIPLTLILVGLPEIRLRLIDQQPYLEGVLDLIKIELLNQDETKDFYKKIFNKVNIKIFEQSLELLWRYSSGYPVFMHEIGYFVFNIDVDNIIDERDSILGIIRSSRLIGDKYIEPEVQKFARNNRYKIILNRIFSDKSIIKTFNKPLLLKKITKPEEKIFTTIFQRMKQIGIIENVRKRGIYKFTSIIYPIFIILETSKKKQ